MERILIVGSEGQIGTELTAELRNRYGGEQVLAADIKETPSESTAKSGPYERLDVTDADALGSLCRRHAPDVLINMAAVLSAVGEKAPLKAWRVNVTGLINSLEAARELGIGQVLCPSSIAVFGKYCPRENTPQDTVLKPSTMYGVTKVAGELLCDYYVSRFGVDARGLRYPGIISSEALPGGGTTDYAVEIFYKAVEEGRYTCFLKEDACLPMMYMPDCIKATIDLMTADFASLEHHGDFNVASMSLTPGEIAAEIRKHIPDFEITCEPDERQAIAESWPVSIDDSAARSEWGWEPSYDLESMTKDMLSKLRARHRAGALYSL
ncbi:MAG: NAD-dependent epimerase/dehydratase family protein [Candidatus Eisenbacteria bacterium]|nr:NAD-dependent epimerase/dehydratase family protein [Candidatus Eisenbacteria bacterium]